jgi:hypothetical protein
MHTPLARPSFLLRAMLRDVHATWQGLDRPARCVALVGLALLASGLLHVGVFAVDGGPWEGPVSWRKPIVFGVSAGLTALSLAWVTMLLPRTPWRHRLGHIFAWALGLEVALITMQRWRGVPSHFNDATRFDSVVSALMGLLIVIVMVITVLWTVQVFRRRGLAPDVAVAARWGLLLLLVSFGLGGAILGHGSAVLADDPAADPAVIGVIGSAGLMKVPHGLALHGMQTLPVLAWLLGWGVAGARHRARLVRMAAAGHGLVIAFAVLQVVLGRHPLDAPAWLFALPLTGVALLAAPYAIAVRRILGARPHAQMITPRVPPAAKGATS